MNERRFGIVGGGAIGLAWAAQLLRQGLAVAGVAEADAARRDALLGAPGLRLSGLEGEASFDMPPVVADAADLPACDWVLVATTADRHAEVAARLANRLADNDVVVLATGYADGAAHFAEACRRAGGRDDPLVIDLNTTPVLAALAGPGQVHVAARKGWMEASATDHLRLLAVIEVLRGLAPGAEPVADGLRASLDNPNPVAHVPALLLNMAMSSAPAVPPDALQGGAFHLDDFVFPAVTALRAGLDAERLAVMAAHGLRGRPRSAFVGRAYGAGSAREPRPPRLGVSFAGRFLSEDLPCGLVPIETLGRLAGCETPQITATITLVSAISGRDWREAARSITVPPKVASTTAGRAIAG